MRITHVKVHGFRSLQEIELDTEKYTTVIGKNDCGKSSFLRAIAFLCDPTLGVQPDDICGWFPEAEKTLSVEAALSECVHALATAGTLTIRRTYTAGHSRLEILGKVPANETLRKIASGELAKGEFTADNTLPNQVKNFISTKLDELTERFSKGNWKGIYDALSDAQEIEMQDGWQPLDEETLSELMQVVFIRADVRGEEEIHGSGKSIFTQVGGLLMRDATRAHEGFNQAVQKLREEIDDVAGRSDEGEWNLDELNQLQTILSEEVKRFDDAVDIEPTILAPQIRTDFSISLNVHDQWSKGLEKMGHGLRRSVVFAMLRAHRRMKIENAAPAVEGVQGANGPLYLFLIEEPELYLHPQAERRRMRELQELSKDENTQIVLCTHSAVFVNLEEYKGIKRFERPERRATNVYGWSGPDLTADDKRSVTLIHQFDPTKAAMLFADLVILGEGQCEADAVPVLAERMELDRPDREVEVVDCGGKVHIFQHILENFGIKYVAWIDSDVKEVVKDVKDMRTGPLGAIVINERNWEKMNGLPTGGKNKFYNSWKHFVFDDNAPNEKLEARIRAAYAWEDYLK